MQCSYSGDDWSRRDCSVRQIVDFLLDTASLSIPVVCVDVDTCADVCVQATGKITQLSVGPLLAQAIYNIHNKKSISALFK